MIDFYSLDWCDEAVFESHYKMLSEETIFALVLNNPNWLDYVENQSEKLCWTILKKDPRCFASIKHPTLDMCKYALEKWPYNINWIENMTEELYLIAVKANPYSLSSINEQTAEMCQIALDHHHSMIYYIKNPSEEMCIYAIEKDPFLIEHIKNPTNKVLMFSKKQLIDKGYYEDYINDNLLHADKLKTL